MKEEKVIFLLENSTNYVFLLDQAFRNAQVLNPIRIARYGNEAILYLKGVGVYGNRQRYPLPGFIILDLAIPDGSAFAVLGWIRRQPELDTVPVVVLADPEGDPLLQRALDTGANAFYVKRDDFDGLARMLKSIDFFGERPSGGGQGLGESSSDHELETA